MPLYEYICVRCGDFTAMASMANYREPVACPNCDALAPRALLTAPALAAMPATTRKAHAVNERARHEPKLSSHQEHRHGPGCGCSSSRQDGTNKAKAAKSFLDKRPWMISH